MIIYCCGCSTDVRARLTSGKEIYPLREDLHTLPFWVCNTCGNYVGCHHKTKQRTTPLGCIPTAEIRGLRRLIHTRLDTLWESRKMDRSCVYDAISQRIGYPYHTADVRSAADARIILDVIAHIVEDARRS